MSTILVRRKGQGTRDLIRRYKVVVDGETVGKLWAGKELEVDVTPGEHRLVVKIDWTGSDQLTVNVDAEETAVFECRPGGAAHRGATDLLSNRPYIHLEPVENRPETRSADLGHRFGGVIGTDLA